MNIQQILDEQNIPYQMGGSHRHIRHGWIGIDCPWCRSGKWHLGINLGSNYAVCWKCGYHRLGDVLMYVTKLPWNVVRKWLVDLESPICKSYLTREPTHPEEEVVLPKGRQSLGYSHDNYLRRRGFNPTKVVREWGVCGISLGNSQLAWRLWIPITLNGVVVSWTTRAIGESTSKYVSARPEEEVVPHKTVLYGADKAHHVVIICEGPIDVWAIGPGAVALFGLGWSKSQLLEIASYPVRAVCLDSSREAQKRAERLCNLLKAFPGETHRVELKSGEDPADASREEIEELRDRFLVT